LAASVRMFVSVNIFVERNPKETQITYAKLSSVDFDVAYLTGQLRATRQPRENTMPHRHSALTFPAALLCALIAFALPRAVAAQTHPMITLFAQDKYRGPSLQLILPANDLHDLGFANRTASFIVQSGTWMLCNQANFRGSCITVRQGKYPSSYHGGFARSIVSLEPATSATSVR
jgi:hypothetical protein